MRFISTLWQFENFRNSKNYKSWNKKIKNVLNTMNILDCCLNVTFAMFSKYVEIDDKNFNIKKKKFVFQIENIEWKIKMKINKTHFKIVKNHIYNKCDEIFQKLMKNMMNAYDVWIILRTQYFDQNFIFKHIIFQKLCNIILKNCDNDLNKLIVTFQKLQKNLKNMKQSINDFIVCSNLFFNLNDRFSKYVFRIVITKKLFFSIKWLRIFKN